MKYSDQYKPLYKERGNVISERLDDEVKRTHKEGGGDKEEEGSKGDNNSGDVRYCHHIHKLQSTVYEQHHGLE